MTVPAKTVHTAFSTYTQLFVNKSLPYLQPVAMNLVWWTVHTVLDYLNSAFCTKILTIMRVKLLLFIFYVNGGLHAVSMGKPSERTDVKFLHGSVLKNESEPNFGFPHIPNGMLMWSVCVAARQCKWSAAGN